MEKNIEIVRERIATTVIGRDGNRCYDENRFKYLLKNGEDEPLSCQYECMISLGNDHFAVCKVIPNIYDLLNNDYSSMVNGICDTNSSKLKWGVIRVNRDSQGSIIPKGESLVIPYLYDRVSSNNLKTATGYYNGRLTYLELDKDSKNYGQQIVPCVLEHAVPFCIPYEGFAECSVDGGLGYLPRDCMIKNSITNKELLSKEQVVLLQKNLEGEEGYPIDYDTIMAYAHLTGRDPNIKKSHNKEKNKVAVKRGNTP